MYNSMFTVYIANTHENAESEQENRGDSGWDGEKSGNYASRTWSSDGDCILF